MINVFSSAAYQRALKTIDSQISEMQRWMLIGHGSSSGHCLSMKRIAEQAGYTSYSTANAHYGKLAHLIADALGQTKPRHWLDVICTVGPKDSHNEWQWIMRPQVADALDALGWLESPAGETLAGLVATSEVENDPMAKDACETERQALINARIGQGGYRKRMLNLWDGRCAVTNCSIEQVLIASHAKAWHQASNIERLDAYNGLLLSASLDRLFDTGLISFRDDGRMLTSPAILSGALLSLGLNDNSKLRFVHEQHKPYLAAHRATHGFNT